MEKKYYSTIGLEIHAELKTLTKMFCACKNDPDEKRPNWNICPVCMAHPGALPKINKKAVENVVKIGLAVGGTIAEFTEFDRKNYFYPDIPKGYQISQYKFPIVSGGELAGMKLTRIHLEEDTANSKHDRGDYSLVDFNRAGVPLSELVTEAHTFETIDEAAKTGGAFGKEYQLLLQYLDASEANMEKGEMRVEANISISTDKEKFGTKVEVKNLNSFRSVERAIRFELERMKALYEEGKEGEIVQETRGWDEGGQKTFSQRKKEDSHDYRYFPDPDLPKLMLSEVFDLEKMKTELPELPVQKRVRYKNEYGIKDEDIEVYVTRKNLGQFFEQAVSFLYKDKNDVVICSSLICNDIMGLITREIQKPVLFSSDALASLIFVTREQSAGHYTQDNFYLYKMSPKLFADLVILFSSGKLSSKAVKDIIPEVINTGKDPLKIATEKDILQKNDEGALKEIAQKIIDANEKVVADYKGGKENALMSLVGAMMKETKGSANPALAKQILVDLLK